MSDVRFNLGDPVRVSQSYFHEVLRGAEGVVSAPPKCVVEHEPRWPDYWRRETALTGKELTVYWVEFAPWLSGTDPHHPIEAAEVDERNLEAR